MLYVYPGCVRLSQPGCSAKKSEFHNISLLIQLDLEFQDLVKLPHIYNKICNRYFIWQDIRQNHIIPFNDQFPHYNCNLELQDLVTL